MFILQLLLLVTTTGLIVFSCWNKIERHDYGKTYMEYGFTAPNVKKMLLVIIPIVLWFGTLCITFIPANTVGIKYSAISGTKEDTLSEGLAFKSPLDRIYKVCAKSPLL